LASLLPHSAVDVYLKHVAGVSIVEDRELARGLLCNPEYAENFITLGMEEIRDVPEKHDVSEHSSTRMNFVCSKIYAITYNHSS